MIIKTLRRTMDVYNYPVSNTVQIDINGVDQSANTREQKLDDFMDMFGPQITIRDLKSKKIILKDRHAFRTRYLTTFRESGTGLMASVNRRVIFTAPAQHSVALALDYETHRQLTTPAGQMLDGSTGLNGPRVLDIAVLYLIKDGKICSIWMTPDRAGVIKDPKMPLEMIQKTDDYSSFASIVKEHLGTVEPRAMYTTRFSCGCHEIKGRRATMEDKSVVFDFQDPAGRTATFVSVYDGHGGHEAAQFLGEHLHSNFQESSGWKGGNALLALEEAFATTDRQLLEAEEPSGSCAVVAVLVDSCLYVAHVGDCRAVLCSGDKWEAIRLTEDHKPDRKDERDRILAAGGDVVEAGCWRVTSQYLSVMMATSRAFGDRAFKTGKHADAHLIISDPELKMQTLSPSDHFLITACDGVWDVLSDQEACDVVRGVLDKKQNTASDVLARELVEAAYNRGSTDNISAIVSVCHF